ncbi:MAG: transketolase [Burkholderiales bacterium]|nr:transketolase [Burkholderiales bacterium]
MPTTSQLSNAIRALAMDAVQQANSGHPGAPMGMADIAEVLWRRHLKHNPADPHWFDRDRFVLSNGHGSMLLYALLHLTGYDLSIDDLKQFRQLHARTPGHPEYGYAPGVETTTGPLGQGLANAVGMAMAEKRLAETFNRPGHTVVDHHTYVFAGDGCLMEGVSHEACSLAGTLGLGKLIVFYDDNGISIDGHVEHWFGDDTPARFEAYGWQVIRAVDGHDAAAIQIALQAARAETAKPTLICCRTVIGKGSPNKAGTHDVHGAPLGAEEIAATRAALGWAHGPFEIPADIRAEWDRRAPGAVAQQAWDARLAAYADAHPDLAAELSRRAKGELPANWAETVSALYAKTREQAQTVATRKASQLAITGLAPVLPEFVGGSADLTGSNLTNWPACSAWRHAATGSHVNWGVREFGMSAALNGMALHGGFIPFGGTFLVFSDYARNAVRMAALMKQRVIFVYTHDSIGLGEDGPTHQPVEHLASLRLIPRMDVWRPCDTLESAVAWVAAVERNDGPSSLVFSRQNLPFVSGSIDPSHIRKGGYVLAESGIGRLDVVLIATGSEVELAVKAREALAAAGIGARVVSMPCCDVFDRQPPAWRSEVLPAGIPRIAIEAGVTDGWRKYVGLEGAVVGLDTFGESAPASALFKHFGFTVDNVVATARTLLTHHIKQED